MVDFNSESYQAAIAEIKALRVAKENKIKQAASREVRLDLHAYTFDQLLRIVRNQSADIHDLHLRVKRLEVERAAIERYWLSIAKGGCK